MLPPLSGGSPLNTPLRSVHGNTLGHVNDRTGHIMNVFGERVANIDLCGTIRDNFGGKIGSLDLTGNTMLNNIGRPIASRGLSGDWIAR